MATAAPPLAHDFPWSETSEQRAASSSSSSSSSVAIFDAIPVLVLLFFRHCGRRRMRPMGRMERMGRMGRMGRKRGWGRGNIYINIEWISEDSSCWERSYPSGILGLIPIRSICQRLDKSSERQHRIAGLIGFPSPDASHSAAIPLSVDDVIAVSTPPPPHSLPLLLPLYHLPPRHSTGMNWL